MVTTVSQLIYHRLYYYVLETGDAIKRQWQLLIIILGLFYAGWDLSTVILPIQRMLSLQVATSADLVYLNAYGLLVFLWIGVQRKAVTGGEVEKFIQTLPVAWPVNVWVQIIMFVVAINVLWIPFVLVMFNIYASPLGTLQQIISQVNLITFMLLFPAIMLHLYAGKFWVLVLFFVATGLLFVAGMWNSELLAVTCSLLLVGLLWRLLVAPVPAFMVAEFRAVNRFSLLMFSSVAKSYAKRFPIFIIYIKLIFKINPIYSLTRLCIGFCLLLIFWNAVHFDGRADIAGSLLLVSTALTTLSLSAFYRLLQREHLKYESYIKTLPLSQHYWLIRDFIFVGGLQIVISLGFVLFAYYFGYINSLELLIDGLIVIALNIILRMIVVTNNRYAVPYAWLITISVIILGCIGLSHV
jgi:hypothetical protein